MELRPLLAKRKWGKGAAKIFHSPLGGVMPSDMQTLKFKFCKKSFHHFKKILQLGEYRR
jgi:hypothetical protein